MQAQLGALLTKGTMLARLLVEDGSRQGHSKLSFPTRDSSHTNTNSNTSSPPSWYQASLEGCTLCGLSTGEVWRAVFKNVHSGAPLSGSSAWPAGGVVSESDSGARIQGQVLDLGCAVRGVGKWGREGKGPIKGELSRMLPLGPWGSARRQSRERACSLSRSPPTQGPVHQAHTLWAESF